MARPQIHPGAGVARLALHDSAVELFGSIALPDASMLIGDEMAHRGTFRQDDQEPLKIVEERPVEPAAPRVLRGARHGIELYGDLASLLVENDGRQRKRQHEQPDDPALGPPAVRPKENGPGQGDSGQSDRQQQGPQEQREDQGHREGHRHPLAQRLEETAEERRPTHDHQHGHVGAAGQQSGRQEPQHEIVPPDPALGRRTQGAEIASCGVTENGLPAPFHPVHCRSGERDLGTPWIESLGGGKGPHRARAVAHSRRFDGPRRGAEAEIRQHFHPELGGVGDEAVQRGGLGSDVVQLVRREPLGPALLQTRQGAAHAGAQVELLRRRGRDAGTRRQAENPRQRRRDPPPPAGQPVSRFTWTNARRS